MATDPSCEECAAILLEYERAYLDFWRSASEETREGCRAIGQLLTGGTEADLDRAREVLPPFTPFRPYASADAWMGPSPMAELAIRRLQHTGKTGHYLTLRPLWFPPLPPSEFS
jgi:hypothetical protein